MSKTTHCTCPMDSCNFVVFGNLLVLINTKLHSKSCRYLKLYDLSSTYSFPVARGIFFGIDLSCFVPQSADTKLLMLPLRTLHWHCWGHSDKQKQASIKNCYLNHICVFESNRWWPVTKYTIRLAKYCSKSSKTKMLSHRNGRHISHHIFHFSSAVGAKQLFKITSMIFVRHLKYLIIGICCSLVFSVKLRR